MTTTRTAAAPTTHAVAAMLRRGGLTLLSPTDWRRDGVAVTRLIGGEVHVRIEADAPSRRARLAATVVELVEAAGLTVRTADARHLHVTR